MDCNSKFVEVAPLRNETAKCVINNVKKIFARHGIPKMLFSDNGSQFTSGEFLTFTTEWDLEHDSSSPEFPKSNGFVKRHIQTVKNVLNKTSESGGDPYLALLALNTTPDANGNSPASRMFNRHPRTNLPSIIRGTNSNCVQNEKRNKTKYDERSKDLKEIESDTSVRIFKRNKRKGNWRLRGKVISKRSEPRSYNVINEKGNIIRRNRQHLLPTNETFNQSSVNEYDSEDSNESLSINEDSEEVTSEPSVTTNDTPSTGYVTRSGRVSREPDRLGY